MTKPAELREHDLHELNQRLTESRQELFNLRFQLATGRLDNMSRITVVRREIARLLTLLQESSLNIRPLSTTTRSRRTVKTTEEE